MSFRVDSVKEYFDTLDKRFRPEGAAKVNAIFQFELAGDDGGTYHVTVNEGTMAVHDGPHENPTCTLKMKAPDYIKMTNGDMNGQMAYMTGKLKIKGSIPMAMKMKNIFPQVGQ
ncbi:MAG: SCP2 sterol-binding domain-containing protein [Myxococcales bacterium]|nr:SCP2 sterol-binding domain-containing protein [Myxococcales bacterium]